MKRVIIIALLIVTLFLLMSSSYEGELNMKDYNSSNHEKATFAGGCFWCMEWAFERQEGVIEVISGFSGGDQVSPTYKEVSSGKTNHIESVQVIYDPSKISYMQLLEIFWQQIDPTDANGQFVDRGHQYTTAIFYHDDEQRELAIQTRDELNESGRFDNPIVTDIRSFEEFFPAEEYHQDYYSKNPVRYKFYRKGSGRDSFLEEVWSKDLSKDDLKEMLTPIQYKVTQEDGTEKPFDNEYWDNKEEGIYVDIVSGEPLFSSKDKYESGTGWPSFTKLLEKDNVVELEDRRLFLTRVEVRSKEADSHLGHVFDDGPKNSTGLRYCINSAALRFIPKDELEVKGYGQYLTLFD